MTTTATDAPFRFFDLRVLRTERLGPTMIRVTFGGEGLDANRCVSGGRDQRFKLFLPHPHQDAPVVPADSGEEWFADWRAMDPAVRAVMRSYTLRAQRPGEIDVDFAMHGDPAAAGAGPAAAWAATARPGDRVAILGPTRADNGGFDFAPPDGTGWVLIAGDETALPAVGGIVESLPAGTRALVWIEVPDAADRQALGTEADADIVWLVRADGERLVDAVRNAAFPDGVPYAWIAGEAGAVRTLRRHLVGERGLDRRTVTFTGYWRRGSAEEDLLQEVLAGGDPHTGED